MSTTVAQIKPLIDHVREYPGTKIVSIDRYRTEVMGKIDAFTFEERISYLKKYGDHCMSFSTLQPGMNYFDVPGMGFIAYKQKWGTRYVLADPVCDVKDRERLIREFLKNSKNVAFVQISQSVAELIHEKFGYYSSQFGLETVVDLEKWDLKGKKKQVLRTSINHATKTGVVIEENYDTDGCKKLTQEWLKTRKVKNREVSFLIRPMEMEYQQGTRKFHAYLDGELIGFVFFDPVYSGGKVIGYVPNISRFSAKFKQGIFYPLMIHAMETFKKEGVKYLYLGLCPMMVGEEDQPYESGIVKTIIRLLYRYGNILYSFKGLYFTKSRFEGTDYKTFCSHRQKLPIKAFLTLFKMANII
jgi:phosphatidylglycerol lysyltransferase